MKTKFLVLCSLVSTLLTGCTVEGDRIYTVCKDTPSTTYVYNSNGDFLSKDKTTNQYSPIEPIGLVSKPMLLLDLSEGSYNLIEELPNKFSCTFDDFNNYLHKLVVVDNCTYNVNTADYKSIELYVSSDNYSLKCFYTNNDFLRLYCIDSDGNPITPPYINEGE